MRVNAVAPGLVGPRTSGVSAERKRALIAPCDDLAAVAAQGDIAEVILFLCTGPQMINAQVITINGGRRGGLGRRCAG